MNLYTTEEMGKFIYDKIMNGWFFLETDIELQSKFEWEFYTPGTPKNEDFQILFASYGGKIAPICIAKLTKDLQNYMNIGDKEFKSIFMIQLAKEHIGTAFNYKGTHNKKARSDFVYNYLNDLLELMEKGEITREFVRTTPKKKPKKNKRKAISKSIRHEVFKRDNYRCVECNASKDDGIVLHLDHIIPVAQGGSDELDNLQTLCQDCNLAKSNRAWKGGIQD